ncbi:ferritin-like domain-containing protein [Clostridium rectalis]|uniref:ferritin-like domain-containing protein n=1 Tax=Clostridium rectalis TaxID=2040295 RepID=UPI000F63EDFA|nr:ferritin-like domain-containing protein [Clostridium rectalis]
MKCCKDENLKPYNRRIQYGMDFSYDGLNQSLCLIKEVVQGEKNEILKYNHLLSLSPNREQKEIIRTIKNDEINHGKCFRQIYYSYTYECVESLDKGKYIKQKTYIEGLKEAMFGKLKAMEKYRLIRDGVPSRYYRDIIFCILTDEMKHALLYNYILTLSLSNKREKTRNEENIQRDMNYKSTQYMEYIKPIISRAIDEKNMGVDIEYLMSKCILSGTLLGKGINPQDTIEEVKRFEGNGEINFNI